MGPRAARSGDPTLLQDREDVANRLDRLAERLDAVRIERDAAAARAARLAERLRAIGVDPDEAG